MAIIKAPDVPAPIAVLCWKQNRLMVRCDRKAGHGGPHSWDHAEPAPSPDSKDETTNDDLSRLPSVTLPDDRIHAETATGDEWPMGKPLFVVTSGCYSDYGVSAIFDDRALAEKYCEGSDDKNGHGMRVEDDFELNPGEARMRADLKMHHVSLDRDGNVTKHWDSWSDETERGDVQMSREWVDAVRLRTVYRFECVIAAKTKEQAIKAANERRARWIAEGNEWPSDEA